MPRSLAEALAGTGFLRIDHVRTAFRNKEVFALAYIMRFLHKMMRIMHLLCCTAFA